MRNPKATRPWQHVLEPLSGYLLLAMKMDEDPSSYSESWNFGPTNSDSQSVEWVVEKLCTLWPGGGRSLVQGDQTMHETSILRLDCSKANMNLHWYARWNIDHALLKTVEWYVNGAAAGNYIPITKEQIAEYMLD
jgi:CDP-glucose 4,6-dehydratase